jgi:hypothetical protein
MTTQDLVAGIKRNPVSIACAVLSVIFVAALFLRSDFIAEAETKLAEKSAEAQKYAANIQYSAQLKEQVDTVTALNKEIDARIIRASQLGTNTQYFYKMESGTDVKMIDLRQVTPATVAKPAKGSFLPVAFAVSVQGDLNHILTFLQQVENGAHYSRVLTASLSSNPAQRGSSLTLALSLELLGTP